MLNSEKKFEIKQEIENQTKKIEFKTKMLN